MKTSAAVSIQILHPGWCSYPKAWFQRSVPTLSSSELHHTHSWYPEMSNGSLSPGTQYKSYWRWEVLRWRTYKFLCIACKWSRHAARARMSNVSSVFRLLQERGSRWLKSTVLFADHQAVVLNKLPNLVCQLRRPTRDSDAEVCCQCQAQPSP